MRQEPLSQRRELKPWERVLAHGAFILSMAMTGALTLFGLFGFIGYLTEPQPPFRPAQVKDWNWTALGLFVFGALCAHYFWKFRKWIFFR
jgi:hypothetical protein